MAPPPLPPQSQQLRGLSCKDPRAEPTPRSRNPGGAPRRHPAEAGCCSPEPGLLFIARGHHVRPRSGPTDLPRTLSALRDLHWFPEVQSPPGPRFPIRHCARGSQTTGTPPPVCPAAPGSAAGAPRCDARTLVSTKAHCAHCVMQPPPRRRHCVRTYRWGRAGTWADTRWPLTRGARAFPPWCRGWLALAWDLAALRGPRGQIAEQSVPVHIPSVRGPHLPRGPQH